MKFLLATLAVITGLFLAPHIQAYSSPGKPTGYVSDYAHILPPETKQQIEAKLANLESSTGTQIAVVTIPSLEGDTIENYAVKLFEEWGIGQKGKDNGVLFLTAINDRKVRIEVGYGLEGTLTDAASSAVIRTVIIPQFKQNNYGAGIEAGTDALIGILSGASSPPQQTNTDDEDSFVGLLVLGFFVFQFFSSLLSRSKSWWFGGILGGIIGLLVSITYGLLWAGLIALAVFVPLGLLLDFIMSRQYSKSASTGHYPWWMNRSGGFNTGSRGGGSSFGGFGGGRSGGGGSSGSW